MFKNTIDFENLPENEFMPLPAGEYTVVVESMNIIEWEGGQKNVKEITPSMEYSANDQIEVCYNLIGDKFSGRLHYDSLRMWHSNEKAANIARARFNDLCKVCGKSASTLENFCELYNKPLVITLKHSEGKNGRTYVNVVKIKAIPDVPFESGNGQPSESGPF